MDTLQFYKAAHGISTLLLYDQLEMINGNLMLRLTDCFVTRYVKNQIHPNDPARLDEGVVETIGKPLTVIEFDRHKQQLYKLYNKVTDKVNDYKIWRLIGRLKSQVGEPIEEIKEIKLKELRAIMKINWEVEVETCELVEKTLGELVDDIFPKLEGGPSDAHKIYVNNTAMVIAKTLQRECKVKA